MSESDEIPEDVLEKAETIADAWFNDTPRFRDLSSDIARAILAERERAARVADRFVDDVTCCGGLAAYIADAIRRPT